MHFLSNCMAICNNLAPRCLMLMTEQNINTTRGDVVRDKNEMVLEPYVASKLLLPRNYFLTKCTVSNHTYVKGVYFVPSFS